MIMMVRSSEDEAQVVITAGNATFYDNPFLSSLRRRNILTQQSRIVAAAAHKVDAFKIFYQPQIIAYFR